MTAGATGRALLLLSLTACSSQSHRPDPIEAEFVVATSDFTSSRVGGLRLDGTVSLVPGVDLGKDPVLSSSRGRTFLLARDLGRLFELDPRSGAPMSQLSVQIPGTAASMNPQDVALTGSGELWVAYFAVPMIGILDMGGKALATIDLASFDEDGNPDASSLRIARVGGVDKAFVVLERLDGAKGLTPKTPARMLRIDVGSRVVEAVLDLKTDNPFNLMREQDGYLYLASPASWESTSDARAGVERVDLASMKSELLVAEKDLMGSALDVAVSGDCGVAIVADARVDINATSLVTFQISSGRVLRSAENPLYATKGFSLSGLAFRSATLAVGDGADGRIRAFEHDGACGFVERIGQVATGQKVVAMVPAPMR